MNVGRKNLRKASKGNGLSLHEGHSIMQVIALRGSNIIEVLDSKGVKSLALFPARFQKSFWIKSGSFVVVDESGRKKALESGSKIACFVSQVLYHDQVRVLEKSSEWPTIFKTTTVNNSTASQQLPTLETEGQSSDEDDGLPPLEANPNRNKPHELCSDSDSESNFSS